MEKITIDEVKTALSSLSSGRVLRVGRFRGWQVYLVRVKGGFEFHIFLPDQSCIKISLSEELVQAREGSYQIRPEQVDLVASKLLARIQPLEESPAP